MSTIRDKLLNAVGTEDIPHVRLCVHASIRVCVIVDGSVLRCVAVCCSVMQWGAVCCSVLLCVVVCCCVRMHQFIRMSLGLGVWECVTVCCSVSQCVAACCSVLQRVALCLSLSYTHTHNRYWWATKTIWCTNVKSAQRRGRD